MSEVSGFSVGLTTHVSTFRRCHARTSAAAPGKTKRIITTAARIVAMAAATPQERAAAVVPALRRGADNGQWCCCHDDVRDNEGASGSGSIAVAGTQVASAPRVSREVFLSHTSRCSVKFYSARSGGRGRGGERSAARRGVRRVSAWAKTLGREVCSPAPWRYVPQRVSAWAKARRPVALSASGGLGRYWAAHWHLARAVGKRFRGCRAERLYVHKLPDQDREHAQISR